MDEILDHNSTASSWRFRRIRILAVGLLLGVLVLIAVTAQWKQHRYDGERDAIARACGVTSDRLAGPEIDRRNGGEVHIFRADISGLNVAGTAAWGEFDVQTGHVDCEVG